MTNEQLKIEARMYVEHRSMPEPNSGCWLWLLSIGSHGYGSAFFGNKKTTAPRVALISKIGRITPGVLAQHKCDNKLCCNPDHIDPGTDATNARDKQLKGRAAKKITIDDARAIKGMLEAGETQRAIASEFGVDQKLVWMIKHEVVWSHA